MSKKIKIPSDNIKSSLVDLFHRFMSNRREDSSMRLGHSYSNYMDDDEIAFWKSQGFIFDDEDDDDDEDDAEVIWPPCSKYVKGKKKRDKDAYDVFWEGQRNSNKKKHKRSRIKKARVIDITVPFSGEEDNPLEVGDDDIYTDYVEIEDNGITNGKEIYYYPDYHNKDNRLEFSSLSGFSDFCEENGYNVPQHVVDDIMFRRVSHTCLRPDAREYGHYEIMAEDSYGTMFYEVCEANELGV
jgi:hypothetical protein